MKLCSEQTITVDLVGKSGFVHFHALFSDSVKIATSKEILNCCLPTPLI
jgi:hypothetical protein